MAKKKKGKKRKKNLHQQFQDMTLKQFLEKAKISIDNQKAREAITLLKRAAKNYDLTDEIRKMLFNAYLIREKQLRSKNMDSEADMVKKQVFEYIPSVETISETDMVLYITASSVNDAFLIYKKYLAVHKPSLKIEQCLANHFIKDRELTKDKGLELIDKLGNDSMISLIFSMLQKNVNLLIKVNGEVKRSSQNISFCSCTHVLQGNG